MLYMSCTLCIYRSIANKQRFHRSTYRVSAHTSSCGSRLPSLVVAQTFESTTVGIMDS